MKAALVLSGIFMLVAGCESNRLATIPIQVNNETCPVTGNPVNDKDTYLYKGKSYKLCSEGCRQALDDEPAAYLSD